MKSPRISVVMELTWPYKRHYGIFAGIQRYAAEHTDWTLDLGNYPEVQLAQGKRFDGIIGRISRDCYLAARKRAIPLVNVLLDSPVTGKAPGVYLDFHSAGRITAGHLLARGLRRLAHVGFAGTRAAQDHFRGMREVAQAHGVSCSRHWVSRRFDASKAQWTRFVEQMESFQSSWEPPMGVGVMADELCRAAASACLSLGWVIPEDLALVGTGNHELICHAIEPTLSSIDMGDDQCGYEAARLLDERLRGNPVAPVVSMTPPRELQVRRSSDVFAVSDSKVAAALRFMADSAGKALSVPIIARQVGLGRQTLERRFRRHVGRSINDELTRLRVEMAKRLLIESDEPVKSISGMSGFGSTVSLHTMFKRHTGLTPGRFRQIQGRSA